MTLISQSASSGKAMPSMTAAEEKKIDIAPVTFFSPPEKITTPLAAKEETKKEPAAATTAVAAAPDNAKR